MKTKMRITGIALLVVAALEFGLLGANAAGLTGRSGQSHDTQGGPGKQRTPTAGPSRETPASIQITPDPLEITCDPAHSETLTVRVTDAHRAAVADGTSVLFQSYGVAQPQPSQAETKRGIATTHLRPAYAPTYDTTIDVRVRAGELNVQVEIPCRGACPISPPAGSPPCATPTPPVSPPPCGSSSPPSVSPPCATPTPGCGAPSSPPSGLPPCPTPTATVTPYPTATPIAGPTLSIRADGLGVTLVASGTGFNPYRGYNYVLAFDPQQIKVSSWQNHLNPNLSFCVTAVPAATMFNLGCILLGAGGIASGGDLATISFAPISAAPGCASVHMFRRGPPDGGDLITGTYTLDANSDTETNPYGTATVSMPVNGGVCGSATDTATATGTPAPSATATP